ncbi:MAG: tetratricopeptide repeat protein [Bryobacteraceae bacterium]|jgi:tetratricopeptide (TPR) repeat protein
MRRSVRETLALAVEHHRAGRLDRAEALYRNVVAIQPNEADALHLLGMLAQRQGRFDVAEKRVRQAITARGRPVAEFSNTLGNVLVALGRSGDAVQCFEEAVAVQPDNVAAHKNLADLLSSLERHVEAEAHYTKVLRLNPNDAATHNNMGGVFLVRGMFQEAANSFAQAIRLDRSCAEAYSNMGHALRELGLLKEAVDCLSAAIRLKPDLGAAHANLGCVLHQLGSHADAIQCAERALTLDPGNASAHNNLGNLFKDQLHLAEAIACYGRAVELRPSFHDAHCNRALTRFMTGEIERAWDEYESGWDAGKRGPVRPFIQPRWDGGPLTGQKLIFWGEQGLGDEIIFAGMVPELTAVAARCIVECEKRLAPLFARSFPAAEVISRTDPPHPVAADADLQIPAGSAGRWLRPSLDRFPQGFSSETGGFPSEKGYLRADPSRVAHWRGRLDEIGRGTKVGICWRSGMTAGLRRLDCTELRDWGPVLAVPNVHFINLQYDDCRAELADASAQSGVPIHVWPDLDLKRDIEEVAGLMTALDIVISVGTSVACLAGALGRPVWQLTQISSGDCWTMGQNYLPWLPSVRIYGHLFDQRWAEVLEKVAVDLANESGQ